MTDDKALLEIADIDQLRYTLEVVHHARSNKISYHKACEALGISRTSFYRWLKAGILEKFLQHELTTMSQVMAATIVDAVPAMITHQVAIATGRKGNPRDATASFQVLMRLVGLESPGDLVMAERESIGNFLDRFRPAEVIIKFEHEGSLPDAERDGEAIPLELPDLYGVVEGEVIQSSPA